ncbi:hypothetical protein GCM10028813_05700 [Ramlibacter alkalitolerans]
MQASAVEPAASSLYDVCASARHAIVWGDAAQHAGRYVPNRSRPATPTANVLAFSTGPIVNESSSPLPAKTNCFVTWTDWQGTSRATRLQSTAPQVFYFYRPTTCPALPPGTYGLKFRCRATAGTGDQSFSYGLTSRLTPAVARDLDWTEDAYASATTFTLQFEYSGVGDIALRLPAAGLDILIDRVQLYLGGIAAIPSWAEESARLHGGRKGFSFPGAIPVDAEGNWKLTADSGGAWILEPGLDDHTYDRGVTVLHACALDDLNAASGETLGFALATRHDARLGTTLSTLHVGFETNVSPYQGQVHFAPSTNFRSQASFQALGQGIVVLGQAADSTGRRMFVDEIPVLTEPVPFAPFKANCWHVGSGSTSARAHVKDFDVVGRHSMTLIWDRALSDEEWAAAARAVQNHLAGKGEARFPDFHVFSGDSNWTKATGDVMQLLSEHDCFGQGRNLWARDTSRGGTGAAEVYGTRPYPAPMDPQGRLLATEVPMMLAALRAGRKVCYHLLWGTNDFTEISGVNNWGVAAYNDTRQAVVDYLLALHPNLWILEYTIVAAGSDSGRWYQPKDREAVNRLRRAQAARHLSPRHRLCDLGGPSSVLGDQATADVGTYLLEPPYHGVHFNRTGDAAAAEYIHRSIVSLRAAMKIW